MNNDTVIDQTLEANKNKREFNPTNFIDCFDILDKKLPKSCKKSFKKKDEMFLIMQHFGTGMWIRNEFGLWDKTSPLYKFFRKKLIFFHEDDISSLIMRAYSKYLNNEIKDFKNCIVTHQNVFSSLKEYYLSEIESDKEIEKFYEDNFSKNKTKNKKEYGKVLYEFGKTEFLLLYNLEKTYMEIKNGHVEIKEHAKKNIKWKASIDISGMPRNKAKKLLQIKGIGNTSKECINNIIVNINLAGLPL
jgi:hypothetical protein